MSLNFDADCKVGKAFEHLLDDIIEGRISVEAKHDFVAGTSGNIALEILNNDQKTPSGIAISNATYFAVGVGGIEGDPDAIVMFKTNRGRTVALGYPDKRPGGDGAICTIIPLRDLVCLLTLVREDEKK